MTIDYKIEEKDFLTHQLYLASKSDRIKKKRQRNKVIMPIIGLLLTSQFVFGQTKQDTLSIRQAALDYIESQHKPNPTQMDKALHPRMVKRTFWKDKATGKDYVRETTTESMVLLAESYNKNGDKFPASPKKEIFLLDVSERTASVKLIADEWIDYMHIVKLNGSWKIINVLWQYKDTKQH